ncbi:MAG: hypothetical protein J5759_00400 [Bacteroidales bacterium]|nr:hypothetical protein [Bacteroidales bacterium]
MKRVTLTLALILSTLMSFAQNKDSEGHTLIGLWKDYYKAEKADKPQDQLKALTAIKQEAAKQHLAWDFYDAGNKYVTVGSSINWKDRSNLSSAFDKEVQEFGEPVAVYFHRRYHWGRTQCEEFAQKNLDALAASYNPEFYPLDGAITGPVYYSVLKTLIHNDYEYVLWSIFGSSTSEVIKDYYKDKYPESALIEYSDCVRSIDSMAYIKLGDYINKYGTKAVTMLARQRRLAREFSMLKSERSTTSDDYKALLSRCEAYVSDRSGYTGDERLIANCGADVDNMISELDSKGIDASITDRTLALSLRNLKNVQVKVCKGSKTVWSSEAANPTGSYYKKDIVTLTVPDLDDGEYEILCYSGTVKEVIDYTRHTLSIALRAISDGYGAFVADYETGRPVPKCVFTLMDADGKDIASSDEMALDGFTQLPAVFDKHLKKDDYKYYSLRARYTDNGRVRLSNSISLRSPNPGKAGEITNYPYKRALILTDRGAYNPGETLHFKGILYTGTYSYDLAAAGTEIKAKLFDTENNLIGEKSLKTNEFGSIEGSFELAGISRGGMFCLKLYQGGTCVDDHYVRVDEFVLPTFELTWDADNRLYLPGDVVKVSGKVTSYSGHNLGSVRAYYKVQGEDEGELELKPDGRFSFEYQTSKSSYYYAQQITVTVADDTGETLEFFTHKRVNSSIPLNVNMLNKVAGRYSLSGEGWTRGDNWIIRDSFARLQFTTAGLVRESLEIFYEVLTEDGKSVSKGKAEPAGTVDVDLKGRPSGMYKLKVYATAKLADGELSKVEQSYTFVKAEDDDTALDMDAVAFFKELGGEDIAVQFGSTDGPVWAVVELIGSGNVLLERQIVTLKGERGKAGSLKTVSYSRKPDYPESLTLNILFFHKGRCHDYSRTIKLPVITKELPLSFTRFVDLANPGQECSLLIATEPGIECAATVFDKATEEINPNEWSVVKPSRRPEPTVNYTSVCGYSGTAWRHEPYVAYGTRAVGNARAKGNVVYDQMMVAEEAAEMSVDRLPADDSAPAEEIHVRENFGATMAWEPLLRSGKDGTVELKFTGSDRLSTYYVQLFAHGEGMKNATLRKEMKVSIPVKVSLVQPLFLYAGDEYTARATLSNSTEAAVSGNVSVRFFNGADYKTAPVLSASAAHVSIPAGGSIPFAVPIDVPEGIDVLGVLVSFVADDKALGSDAMFVSVPSRKPLQTITEAHSAVLLAGADREALIAELRGMFVNTDASALVPVERDILAMIREAIPDSIEPKSKNVLDLTEAYYSNMIARRVGADGLPDNELADIMGKIAACQNTIGGFAWFEGMESSPIVTAAVLQRIASMPEADIEGIDVAAAVKYLDSDFFCTTGRPWWMGTISLPTYLHTRALFPEVPFEAPAGKVYRQFKKEVKEYLIPARERGLNGQILAKARRLRILQLLVTKPEGKTLAKEWGLGLRRCGTLRSYDADVESLLQYAVDHRCGGCYYPNAVMPWRGLMESELYAHALLCDLMATAADWGKTVSGKPAAYAEQARKTAEGIRLWLMIQKETQQWEKDAAYIEAIACVLRGTPETLQTKVILLSSTFTKPFPEIKAAGNGFTVERIFVCNGAVLQEGDAVKVGDRIEAQYKIWNEENRSFVRLTAPRPASMRPVDQLSGHYGWWLRPMSHGSWSFTPHGYRNVLADKTEYWFDSYPEEYTTITEEFFVTQEGAFQMPAVEIESLYAPHYRANDAGRGALVSR